MTTVTEKQKRLLDDDDRSRLAGGSARLRDDPELATRFAQRLVDLAQMVVPERRWTIEELREALELATRAGPDQGVQTLEGRLLRKRLVEQCALAAQYGDGFGCIAIALAGEPPAEAIDAVVRAAGSVLRRSDMAFAYRRRVFLVLPRVRPLAFPSLVDRVRDAVAARSGEAIHWSHEFFGAEAGSRQAEVLDWAEDQLRES